MQPMTSYLITTEDERVLWAEPLTDDQKAKMIFEVTKKGKDDDKLRLFKVLETRDKGFKLVEITDKV